MKSKVGYVLLIGSFLSALGIFAPAQDKKISKEDFEVVSSTYKSFLAKEPYRIRYTHETFPYGDAVEPEKISIWFVEFAPPDREHHYHGRNSADPNAKYERIVIGGEIFTNRGGTWKRFEPPKGGMSFTSGPARAEYFVRGSERLGGFTTTTYEVISGSNFARGNGPMQTSYFSSKYWISSDGRIRKYVGHSDAMITKRNRTTEIYEYDSKIKIEAPIK